MHEVPSLGVGRRIWVPCAFYGYPCIKSMEDGAISQHTRGDQSDLSFYSSLGSLYKDTYKPMNGSTTTSMNTKHQRETPVWIYCSTGSTSLTDGWTVYMHATQQQIMI